MFGRGTRRIVTRLGSQRRRAAMINRRVIARNTYDPAARRPDASAFGSV
jgi:hypothetical protein